MMEFQQILADAVIVILAFAALAESTLYNNAKTKLKAQYSEGPNNKFTETDIDKGDLKGYKAKGKLLSLSYAEGTDKIKFAAQFFADGAASTRANYPTELGSAESVTIESHATLSGSAGSIGVTIRNGDILAIKAGRTEFNFLSVKGGALVTDATSTLQSSLKTVLDKATSK